MHWADVEADKLDSKEPLIATGEAPSGPIHLGHIREVLTGEAISRASGGNLLLIVDSIDPLRRSYPFLDDTYENHIGKPLSEIPCPCGDHDNYAEHFMRPFVESLKKLGANLRIEYAHEMYERGDYEEVNRKIISEKDKVAKIIEEETGRELEEDWFPYNPICSECGKIDSTEAIDFDDPYVNYRCGCGHEGKADIRKADGKLPWRCDWPARWFFLGIDCEPFGKDHSASGGSWDTGKRIIEEIFEVEPPQPVVYEWIQLKGEGPMSSSSGIAIKTEDVLDIISPDVLRFLIMNYKPKTHIDFDPGLGILDLVDDYDTCEEDFFKEKDEDQMRTYELSQVDDIPSEKPQRISYRHLVNLVQIYEDYDKIWEVVQKTDQIKEDRKKDYDRFINRAKKVENWLDKFGPDMVKFSLKEELPDVDLDEKEKEFLKNYLDELTDSGWEPDKLHRLVHSTADEIDISKGKAFRSFYKILLDQNKGPRLGRFLSQLDRDFVEERLEKAI